MAEPARRSLGGILISSDDPDRRRLWPDPTSTYEVQWKAFHAPDQLSAAEIRELARVAEAYAHIFEISQRQFLPTHAAIRALLGTDTTEETPDA